MQQNKKFFYAKNLSELQEILKSHEDLSLLGGCTAIKTLKENSLCLRKIPELRIIEKRERYIELGPAVTLAEIESYGANRLPPMIFEAVKSIGTKLIRNMATIGGNILTEDFYGTLYAPLLALDARLEFARGIETIYIPLSKFEKIPRDAILTKIRIPIDDWDISYFRKIGSPCLLDKGSASFAFLASSLKNQVANMRVAFAGPICFRDNELENILQGAFLPLSASNIKYMMHEAEERFGEFARENREKVSPMLEHQFLNLLKYSLEKLS
ncbi:FAD binding domain-containing protein [Treponema zioleckii]|uniref:FAD binding domain-containing protein n=1 Tax=Treponema zioleckii TaxID=331680 RepID=UPI00168A5284|nr:FAD binding domain-containing protein [Treponema zioleckii]